MSKAINGLKTIKYFNLFANENPKVQFFASKDSKVTAHYSGFDTDKGYDIKGINDKSKKNSEDYIRLLARVDGEFVRGFLYPEKNKRSENSADFTGTFGDEKTGEVRIAAWKKTGQKAGEYLSVSVSDGTKKDGSNPAPASQDGQQHEPSEREIANASAGTGFDDFDDDIPF